MGMNRKIMIGTMLIAIFVFLVSFGTLYAQTHIIEGTACTCTLPIPLLIPTFSSFGIIIGTLVYYLLSPQIEKKKESKLELIKKLVAFLPLPEREIVEKIVENDGEILQSELSKNFGKVKTFRILENLRSRGIIIKEPYGKTNKVKLVEYSG